MTKCTGQQGYSFPRYEKVRRNMRIFTVDDMLDLQDMGGGGRDMDPRHFTAGLGLDSLNFRILDFHLSDHLQRYHDTEKTTFP